MWANQAHKTVINGARTTEMGHTGIEWRRKEKDEEEERPGRRCSVLGEEKREVNRKRLKKKGNK